MGNLIRPPMSGFLLQVNKDLICKIPYDREMAVSNSPLGRQFLKTWRLLNYFCMFCNPAKGRLHGWLKSSPRICGRKLAQITESNGREKNPVISWQCFCKGGVYVIPLLVPLYVQLLDAWSTLKPWWGKENLRFLKKNVVRQYQPFQLNTHHFCFSKLYLLCFNSCS
jgi:hypothetical protein